ncbi:hypothetical protein [Streptomyces sp. CBMA152]|uniref:hypothetical protein n=1 Tax=Streptomyces sp. CBMA152 TaxID=1896312 RepID=UPI001660A73F|nr:hypothetical protein [Streptomyces sp. CBMA152]MBD0741897.1 hypothetical protein [Streptomyces sp. CBMA152]
MDVPTNHLRWHREQASRLRHDLADQPVDEDWIKNPVVEAEFRHVPRHWFVPEISLETAYNDAQVITERAPASGFSTVPRLLDWQFHHGR